MVLELVKWDLKVNFAYIDEVLIVCAGRIESIHAENIRQILEWLKFKAYRLRFTFMYNKADLLPQNDREVAIMNMCESLGIRREVMIGWTGAR